MSRPIAKGGSRGTLFRKVAADRFRDAAVLLREKRFEGAIYLAGYAIECHLKFAVCERRNTTLLPALCETHNWDDLVQDAGIQSSIDDQKQTKAIYSSLVEIWSPAIRYQSGRFSTSEASLLYKEIEQLYKFLKELVP